MANERRAESCEAVTAAHVAVPRRSRRTARWLLLVLLLLLSLLRVEAAPIRIALSRRVKPAHTQQPNGAAITNASDTTRQLAAVDSGKRVPLRNYGNVQYIGQVAFGNPLQAMDMVFDTGSSDTWIPGVDCDTCGSHTRFKHTLSTTFLDTRTKFFDAYGSGSVAGTIAVDTVTLGAFRVESVPFGVVQAETEKLEVFLADGIFGLGFEGLAHISRPTLFTQLAQQNPAIDNMFAFYLTPDAYARGSELHIGGYDLSVVGRNASFHYTPVVKLPEFDAWMYWTVKMTSFSRTSGTTQMSDSRDASDSVQNLCDPFCYAIVDTGTSLISVPRGMYAQVLHVVSDGLNCNDVDCDGVALHAFPTLRIGMAPDNVFLLQPADYVLCYGWSQCRIQFQVTDDAWWILGDVFLKTYYTLFDAANMRVGFACDGDVCQGGRGDVVGGGDDDVDRTFVIWERAFLAGACLAAASMFLFVFIMNQQDETDETDDCAAANGLGGLVDRPFRAGPHNNPYNDPKRPLLSADSESPPMQYGDSTSRFPVVVARASSYEDARRNFAGLPLPGAQRSSQSSGFDDGAAV